MSIFVAMERIAIRVKAIRKLNKWTQRELADKCGLSVTTINHIENGKNTDLETIHKIEEALEVTLY